MASLSRKSSFIKKKDNGKRLKFKDHHRKAKSTLSSSSSSSSSSISSRNTTSEDLLPSRDHSSPNNESSHPKHKYTSPPTNSKPQEYIEWGPAINGYQFIATSQSSTPQYFKPKTIDYLVNSYDWSYMKVPDFESFQEYLHEKYPQSSESQREENQVNFDEYFKHWETEFKVHGLITYPLFTGDDLSKENVLKFVQTSSMPLKRVFKIERVKWHPDKFAKLTKDNEELEAKITEVFQIVNEIYEDGFK